MKKIGFIILLLLCGSLVNAQSDSLAVKSSIFFNLFIDSKAEAYSYFAEEFKSKVSADQILALPQQFALKFGKFNRLDKAAPLKRNGLDYVLLNTSFELANPLFVLTFDQHGKIVGLFVQKENLKATYKDPAYVNSTQYKEEKITIETGEFKLPGIFTKPATGSNFQVIILVHGSGPGDKDGSSGNNKLFRDLALGLATKGIATIRYDKRTKIYGAKSAPTGVMVTIKEEVTDDVLSAVKLAETLPAVDAKNIYVLGHSLGAMLAPKIATENKALAGIILMSGPARTLGATLKDQFNYLIQDKDALAAQLALADEIEHAATIKDQNKFLLGAPVAYFTNLNAYDQVQTAKKLKLPILVLQGDRDYQVTLKDLAIWQSALAKNKNVTIKSYPKLNHIYTEGEGILSSPAEYETPSNVPVYVIDDLANWILKLKK
jgi:fermentation-respiration switch protein FrsA (DUF1100 family)